CDNGSLIQAVAAYNTALALRDDAVKIRRREHHRKHADRNLGPWKVAGEIMCPVKRAERVVTDLPAYGGVLHGCAANGHSCLRLCHKSPYLLPLAVKIFFGHIAC